MITQKNTKIFIVWLKQNKGLLLNKPRAATILVREDAEFAVLNAEDYRKILYVGEMEQMN